MISRLKLLLRMLYKFVVRRTFIDHGLVRRFVAANSPHWSDSQGVAPSSDSVLIEGFHLTPHFAVNMGRAAAALRERRGLTPVVLFGPGIFSQPEYRDYYRSFGVRSFVNVFSRFFSPVILFRALWRTLAIYRDLGSPEKLLDVTLNGLPVGDLLYDSYLQEHKAPTIWKHGLYLLPFLFKCMSLYYYYLYLLNERSVAHVVIGHEVSAPFGFLVRIATSKGIPVTIGGGDFRRTFFDLQDNFQHSRRPPEHLVERLCREPEVIAAAERYMSDRLSGEIRDLGARLAFRGKRVLTKEELTKALDLDPNLPNVFIMAHVFCDTPCGCGRLLFQDFYWWLRETLEATRVTQSCNWIVKPHPSAHLYGEAGAMERLMDHLAIPGIRLAPPDMSTASLINGADAMVTARGTAAMEFACFGIPSLIAGPTIYSGFGIANEPKTREEYFSLLRDAHRLPRLTDEQIARAKAVVYLTQVATEHSSPMLPRDSIPAEVLFSGDRAANQEAQSKVLLQIVEYLESGCTPRDQYFETLAAFLVSGDSHFYNEALISLSLRGAGESGLQNQSLASNLTS